MRRYGCCRRGKDSGGWGCGRGENGEGVEERGSEEEGEEEDEAVSEEGAEVVVGGLFEGFDGVDGDGEVGGDFVVVFAVQSEEDDAAGLVGEGVDGGMEEAEGLLVGDFVEEGAFDAFGVEGGEVVLFDFAVAEVVEGEVFHSGIQE